MILRIEIDRNYQLLYSDTMMMTQWMLFHVEVILSGAGFLMIFLLPHVLPFHHEHSWRLIFIVVLLIALVAGVAVSAARRSKRIIRQTTIKQLQAMLNDVATNQLALIQVNTMLARPVSEKHAQNVLIAIENLQQALSALSEESLEAWRTKYEITKEFPAEAKVQRRHVQRPTAGAA